MAEFAINFEAVAIVNSMLIENINMQMEAEVADLLDRRMMSLFGMNTHKNPNKVDVQNTSKRLQDAQRRSPEPVEAPQTMNYANDTVGTENI